MLVVIRESGIGNRKSLASRAVAASLLASGPGEDRFSDKLAPAVRACKL
jgi:hypothetical protein